MNIRLTKLSPARSTKSLFMNLSLGRDSRGIFVISSSVPLMRGRGPRKSNRPESHHVPRCNHGYPAPDPGLIIIYVSYSAALHTAASAVRGSASAAYSVPSVARLRGNILPLQFQPPSKIETRHEGTMNRETFARKSNSSSVFPSRLPSAIIFTPPLLLHPIEVFVRYLALKIFHP